MTKRNINRADYYRAMPGKQKWRKDGSVADPEIAALVKEHGPTFDEAHRRYRGDHDITACVRAFRGSASMRMRFTETVQWLESLSDLDFDIPEMRDFNAVCRERDKRLYAVNLPSHVSEMRKTIERLKSRVATLREAEKRQGISAGETEIVFPDPKSGAPLTTNTKFDARRRVGA
jgi:hypothetical protein